MDANIKKALNDKLYERRKAGALDLEKAIRDAFLQEDHRKIAEIIDQLCNDFAFVTHQPHARNGGLIGLAAASIALGSEVARYLKQIVPPVLACFGDQDARVRYYACESMYNIAKVAKGEILVYFNEVFDALSKLAADSELSVKNGAELLDRLIKDIVSESAASYISVLHVPGHGVDDSSSNKAPFQRVETPTAFSLSRFIPLLQQRIYVINPFTRMFLVGWITLLDSIPDLELVSYLPSFLGGLLKFLSDPNEDVRTATHMALERFLSEIKQIARVKRGIAQSRRSAVVDAEKRSEPSIKSDGGERSETDKRTGVDERLENGKSPNEEQGSVAVDSDSTTANDEVAIVEEEWIPGQDVQIDYRKILDILVTFLSDSSEEQIQLTTLRWIDSFFKICAEDILPFVPRLLSQVLPALSSDMENVRQAASRVNSSLREYIFSMSEEVPLAEEAPPTHNQPSSAVATIAATIAASQGANTVEGRDSVPPAKAHLQKVGSRDLDSDTKLGGLEGQRPATPTSSATTHNREPVPGPSADLDYEAAVSALTLQFLNQHETTRIAALSWLIMLHRRAQGKIVAITEGTFPALLKTLSDPSEVVVTRDLQLLSQISKDSDDSYFSSFMVNLLKLFRTDRRLLETRGNLIIRQLCVTLSAERIYRTLADCLEKDVDVEFASIMVQNLNNNLITAPELADLRRRLRNLDAKDGQTFFVALFRSWCHNAVATFSLCLLAQAYEQAYSLLQVFADLEMTVNMLIQIDKLVQLLESPVFTYLRLQLLEPERYPYLYKCLYGLLMLLPQSSAFAALRNRLNSVSAIGYLHVAPRAYVPSSNPMPALYHARQKSLDTPSSSSSASPSPGGPVSALAGRLKGREEGGVRWSELLERFKTTQERGRLKAQGLQGDADDVDVLGVDGGVVLSPGTEFQPRKEQKHAGEVPGQAKGSGILPGTATGGGRATPAMVSGHRAKSSFSNLGRFATGMGKGVVKGRDKR